ncbi:hypothetical protein M409DRAFT_31074 [Zasmidium cellare ATCC 36951]|uniref:4a-hydroxytetrahydrobiopterin dehydratase n=1 Tax=Zasmidium cellare ATCC 36951 TaxID=1080233 RepID=A0A6A6BWS5_ZASCE|nr:uncharacterized protein M409DRAFT_31074 [Zasmidium cellare ATCC 36951]KAF2158410.1 hypothetical protein M409DRAFT_31074 [Zasmidium cellare ATCC 36951]
MDVGWSNSDAFDKAKWEPMLAELLGNGWRLCGDKNGKPNGVVKTISFQKDLQREAFDRVMFAVRKLCHHDPELCLVRMPRRWWKDA